MIKQTQYCLKCQWHIEVLFGLFDRLFVGEFQHRALGLWSIALPSSIDNYFSFEQQLIAQLLCLSRDWTINHRPSNYHVPWAVHYELDVEVGHAQQHFIIKWKGCYIHNWTREALKSQVSYMKKWPNCSFLLHCLLFLTLYQLPLRELTGEENCLVVYGFAWHSGVTQKWTALVL